jgi:hypothetical protein
MAGGYWKHSSTSWLTGLSPENPFMDKHKEWNMYLPMKFNWLHTLSQILQNINCDINVDIFHEWGGIANI